MITQEDESRYVKNLLITAAAIVVTITLVFLSVITFSEHISDHKTKTQKIHEVIYAPKAWQEQEHHFSQR